MKITRNTAPKFSQLLPLGAMALGIGVSSAPTHAQSQQDTTLPAVNVEANADKPDGYLATTTRVGKFLQSPQDIPQAVTVITSTLLEEQQVSSLKDALRNVSGLSFNAAEGGRSGDNMNLRGFYTFGDLYLDGIRDTAQMNRETFNLDQIDVLRGAGAMLFGRGQAGGVINQVTKTPLRIEQYKAGASVGTEGYSEVTVDLNKPFTQQTVVRVNAMKRHEGNIRNNPSTGSEPDIDRNGLGISLGLNQQTNSQFWLNYYHLETNDNPDYGMSFDATTRLPGTYFSPKTFWGTDSTFDKSDTKFTTLVHEYRFANDTQLRTQIRSGDYERSYWARTPSLTQAPNPQALVLNGTGPTANGGPTRISDYETVTVQSDFTTRLKANGMTHEILAGIEYLHEDSYRHSLRNVGGLTAANPPRYLPYDTNPLGVPITFKSDSYAIYAQDTVEFVPAWKATFGLRRDQMDANYSSLTSPKLSYGENSIRSALSFQPIEDTHYYLAYSDSFSPTADLYQLTVKPQPAERSDVIELGAKWLLFEGDLAVRTALYQATKDWERNTDLESTAAILTNKRRTKGFELEVAGRINEHLEIFSGLALMHARILEVAQNVNVVTGAYTYGNAGYIDQKARNTPDYTFNLWTTYALSGGWKVGGGAEGKGKRYGFNPSSAAPVPTLPGSTEFNPNTAPAYVRYDAMAAYETNRWTVRLNAKNLLDKVYYDAVYDNGGFATPGTRRTFILSGEFKFL